MNHQNMSQNNSGISPNLSPFETLYTNSKKVSCDGGKGYLGHPRVYLNMGENDFVICPYCSKFFTIKKKNDFVLQRKK
jgi:uncharacterized Zn-finger protein